MVVYAPQTQSTFEVTLNGTLSAAEQSTLQAELNTFYGGVFCGALLATECEVEVNLASSSATDTVAANVVVTATGDSAAVVVVNATPPSPEAAGGLEVLAVSSVTASTSLVEVTVTSPSMAPTTGLLSDDDNIGVGFAPVGGTSSRSCDVWLPFIIGAHAFSYAASRLFGGAVQVRNWIAEQEPGAGRRQSTLSRLPRPPRHAAAVWWGCLVATTVMCMLSYLAGSPRHWAATLWPVWLLEGTLVLLLLAPGLLDTESDEGARQTVPLKRRASDVIRLLLLMWVHFVACLALDVSSLDGWRLRAGLVLPPALLILLDDVRVGALLKAQATAIRQSCVWLAATTGFSFGLVAITAIGIAEPGWSPFCAPWWLKLIGVAIQLLVMRACEHVLCARPDVRRAAGAAPMGSSDAEAGCASEAEGTTATSFPRAPSSKSWAAVPRLPSDVKVVLQVSRLLHPPPLLPRGSHLRYVAFAPVHASTLTTHRSLAGGRGSA